MEEYIGKSYKCESNNGYKDFLTIDKSYVILDMFNNSVVVMSDIGITITVDKLRFSFNYSYN